MVKRRMHLLPLFAALALFVAPSPGRAADAANRADLEAQIAAQQELVAAQAEPNGRNAAQAVLDRLQADLTRLDNQVAQAPGGGGRPGGGAWGRRGGDDPEDDQRHLENLKRQVEGLTNQALDVQKQLAALPPAPAPGQQPTPEIIAALTQRQQLEWTQNGLTAQIQRIQRQIDAIEKGPTQVALFDENVKELSPLLLFKGEQLDASPFGLTVGGWGSGSAKVTRYGVLRGLQGIEVQTNGYYRGARFDFAKPASIASYFAKPKLSYLQFDIYFFPREDNTYGAGQTGAGGRTGRGGRGQGFGGPNSSSMGSGYMDTTGMEAPPGMGSGGMGSGGYPGMGQGGYPGGPGMGSGGYPGGQMGPGGYPTGPGAYPGGPGMGSGGYPGGQMGPGGYPGGPGMGSGGYPGGQMGPGGYPTGPGAYPGGQMGSGGYPGGPMGPGGYPTGPGAYPGGAGPGAYPGGQMGPGGYPGGVGPVGPGGYPTGPGAYPGGQMGPGGYPTGPGAYPGGAGPGAYPGGPGMGSGGYPGGVGPVGPGGYPMGMGGAQGEYFGAEGEDPAAMGEYGAMGMGMGMGSGMGMGGGRIGGFGRFRAEPATEKLKVVLETDIGPIAVEDFRFDSQFQINRGWTRVFVPVADFEVPAGQTPTTLRRLTLFGDADDAFYVGMIRFITDEQPITPSIQTWGAPALQAVGGRPLNVTATVASGYSILDYEWEWGDGEVTTTDEPFATHVYTEQGEKTITLRVRDIDGLKPTATTTVKVNVQPYVAGPGMPGMGMPGMGMPGMGMPGMGY